MALLRKYKRPTLAAFGAGIRTDGVWRSPDRDIEGGWHVAEVIPALSARLLTKSRDESGSVESLSDTGGDQCAEQDNYYAGPAGSLKRSGKYEEPDQQPGHEHPTDDHDGAFNPRIWAIDQPCDALNHNRI